MTEQITTNEIFSLTIPEQLGGGAISESEYKPTAGTSFLINEILGVQGVNGILKHNSLVELVSLSRHDYLAKIIDEELGHEIMKAYHSTAGLISDQYDIAEALRLTDPTASLIEANLRLNKDLTAEEKDFLVKRSSLSKLHTAITAELEHPYRQLEEADSLSKPLIHYVTEAAYEIEDEVVGALDAANRQSVSEAIFGNATAQKIGNKLLSYGLDYADVVAFYSGELSSIPFYKISLAHTLASADAITEIAHNSQSGHLSAIAAAGQNRVFAWSGKQVELELPWYSDVLGGSANQN